MSDQAIAVWMIIGLIVAVLLGVWWYESEYPCLEYGREKIQYMQKVGEIYYPVYGRDCIRRDNS